MINLTWLLPKNLIEGKDLAEWQIESAKSEAFARLFGIDPDDKKSSSTAGKKLSKEQILLIMKKIGIGRVIGKIILKVGDFPYYPLRYYRFCKRTTNKYQLTSIDDGYPG